MEDPSVTLPDEFSATGASQRQTWLSRWRTSRQRYATKPWSLAHRIGFRFTAIFLLLFIEPWSFIPVISALTWNARYIPAWWVQENLFGQPALWYHGPTGSGDTIDDWFSLVAFALIAAIATIVWSVLARKRKDEAYARAIFRVVMRLSLAAIMLGYGVSKLLHEQMPSPSLGQLSSPLGALSPMRLAWLYTGYSGLYEAFGGALEVIGGLLLLHRRTTIFGSLLLVGVMANVATMNFAYDIPVKIHSTIYLLIALYLAMPYIMRLYKEYVLHRRPENFPDPSTRGTRIAAGIVGALVVIEAGYYIVASQAWWKEHANSTGPLYGTYEVLSYSSPSADTSYLNRWRTIVIGEGNDREGYGSLIQSGVRETREVSAIFPADSQLVFSGGYDDPHYRFQMSQLDSVTYRLSDTTSFTHLELVIRKYDPAFPLQEKPFHWVSAYPY